MKSKWLPEGWRLTKLGDLGEVNRGRSRHRPRYAEHLYGSQYPFIQTGDIKNSGGRITCYHQAYSEAGLAQSRLWPPGTMCITIAANIAETAILTFPACFPDSIVGFISDKNKCDVNFIEFMFRFLRKRIQHEATGSVQDNINLGTLDRLQFPIPPLPEQRAIAHILGTLDDKIELNRRMNETLEAMAQALFKSWFLDFDQENLLKNWHEGKVEELVTLSRESINPGEFTEEIFDHYSIPAFDEGRWPNEEKGEQIRSNKFLVPPNSVLISRINPRFPRVWFPSINESRHSVSSTEFLIAIPRRGVSREYLYGLFSSKTFFDVFSTLVTGTSSSHQRVKSEYLLAIDITIPPAEAIEQYTKLAKPIHEQMLLHLEESRTLASIRDTLLLKLLSGEIRIKDSEKFVEGKL